MFKFLIRGIDSLILTKQQMGHHKLQPPQVLLTKDLEYFSSNTCTYNTLKFRIFSYLIDEGKRVTEFLHLICFLYFVNLS